MKAKSRKSKSDKPSTLEKDFRIRPIREEDYPWTVETDQFTYHRLYCTFYAVLYEKYRGEIRVSYCILSQGKDIYNLNEALTYADQQRGEQICQFTHVQM